METRIQSPVQIVMRLQQSPNDDLDVAAAFAKQPDVVREALLDAIRIVQLPAIDIALLRIEDAFRSALKQPWKEPKLLRPVLEACRQGKVKSRTEKLFYQHGEGYGVVALCLATKSDGHRLFRDIDSLEDEELIKLIDNVQKIKKKAAIVEYIEEFMQAPSTNFFSIGSLLIGLPESVVSDPAPQFTRPRSRKKG